MNNLVMHPRGGSGGKRAWYVVSDKERLHDSIMYRDINILQQLSRSYLISCEAEILLYFKKDEVFALARENKKWAAYAMNCKLPGFLCLGTDFYELADAKSCIYKYRVDEEGDLYLINED